jgi:hypothetical protein
MLIEICLRGHASAVLVDVDTPGARKLISFNIDDVQCVIARLDAGLEATA